MRRKFDVESKVKFMSSKWHNGLLDAHPCYAAVTQRERWLLDNAAAELPEGEQGRISNVGRSGISTGTGQIPPFACDCQSSL